MSEVNTVRQEMHGLRSYVENQFSEFREDFRKFSKDVQLTMKQLVSVEGEGKRVADAVRRIGREVEDHELRIRSLEKDQPLSLDHRSRWDRLGWLGISVIATAAGSGVTGIIVYMVTR